MRKIKELLRLRFCRGFSTRQIAASLDIGVGTTHEYLARAREAGVEWPASDDLTEQELDVRLLPAAEIATTPPEVSAMPDWSCLDKELKRRGVTLRLLWEEYRTADPSGLGYSQFCKRYADFRSKLDPRMRQVHKAAEKLFVDYAGMTIPFSDPTTGEIHEAAIFVATMGASSFTFAEATLTQTIADWIGSHVRAFSYFGGVPELLVPDNLKSGVTRACRYEPVIQRTYEDMADHYGIAILPARPVKPRDKAKVEKGVQTVEERMLAPLRNHQFFGIAAINAALAPLLEDLNGRKMQGRSESRAELFAQIDRPALKPLPARPYEIGYWGCARVSNDYHVDVDKRFYSVPFTLIRQEVNTRRSGQVVEVFHKGERVASHAYVAEKGGASTIDEHRPPSHKKYASMTPERMIDWLAKTGPYTRQVGEAILGGCRHPQQGVPSCLGLTRLSEKYGPERMETACRTAIAISCPSYHGVKAVLANNLDRVPEPVCQTPTPPVEHANIRGADYYRTAADTDASRNVTAQGDGDAPTS